MQVYDQLNCKWIDRNDAIRVVVHQLDKYVIYGYVSNTALVVDASLNIIDCGWIQEKVLFDTMREFLFYGTHRGCYVSKINLDPEEYVYERYAMRKMAGDRSVYSFTRGSRNPVYEAVDRFSLFKNKQKILDESVEYKLAKYMPYTFGLEFETSQGCIPEPVCFRDGLIPLRDGSISGYEYSTVILQGNTGLQLLKQQTDSLKEYTSFDKECSLHIHIGGYPQNPEYIFRVYYLCKCLESTIATMIPPLTFKSKEYKANEKDYCKRLKTYTCFNELYYGMTGSRFFGDLHQAHPQDLERKRKWQVQSRYFWINVINAICYNVNKTIEFRFLRPTYNYKKITLWLYILNAIMRYAEINTETASYNGSLKSVINEVYPEDIAYEIMKGVYLLRILTNTQMNNNDLCGQQVHLEDRLFTDDLCI